MNMHISVRMRLAVYSISTVLLLLICDAGGCYSLWYGSHLLFLSCRLVSVFSLSVASLDLLFLFCRTLIPYASE